MGSGQSYHDINFCKSFFDDKDTRDLECDHVEANQKASKRLLA